MPGVVMAVMHWSVEVMLEWPQVGQERRMRMHIVGLGVFLCCHWSWFLLLGVVGCGCTGEQTQLKYTVIPSEERSCVVYTKEKKRETSEKEEEGEKERRMRTLYLYTCPNPACSIVQYM